MDECKVCGRKNPVEGANFCYYCGASLRESDRDERDDPEDRRVIDAEQGRKTGRLILPAHCSREKSLSSERYIRYPGCDCIF